MLRPFEEMSGSTSDFIEFMGLASIFTDESADRALKATSYSDFLKSEEDRLNHSLEKIQILTETIKLAKDSQSAELLADAEWFPAQWRAQIKANVEPSDDLLRGMLNALNSDQFQSHVRLLNERLSPVEQREAMPALQSISEDMAHFRNEIANEISPEDPPISVIYENLWPTWPSWLPDWRSDPAIQIPFFKSLQLPGGIVDTGGILWESGVYSASGNDASIFADHGKQFAFEGDQLSLHGFRVDIIKSVSLLDLADSTFDHNANMSMLEKCIPNDLEAFYSATGESVYDAFQRTVTADIIYDGYLPVARGDQNLSVFKDSSFRFSESPAFSNACGQRLLAVTAGALMGLVPTGAMAGDEIFVMDGGQVFYVLRPKEASFIYIGECYLHGLMDGEVLERLKDGTAKVRDIRLV
jgi:hypothetical protein